MLASTKNDNEKIVSVRGRALPTMYFKVLLGFQKEEHAL